MEFEKIKLLSFDCYGTLIDWQSAVQDILEPCLNQYGPEFTREEIFESFLKADRELESGSYMLYSEILAEIVLRIADDLKISIDPAEKYILSEKFNEWLPFPDTVAALKDLKKDYQLAIISNVDDNLFEITNDILGVEFDFIVTAEQLQSYKPAEKNFIEAHKRFGLTDIETLHVAQSIYHDILPSNRLGLQNVWVNRYSEPERTDESEFPDLEAPDLQSLVRILQLERA